MMKLRILRWRDYPKLTARALNPTKRIFIRGGQKETCYTERRRGCEDRAGRVEGTRLETGVMQPQAKECQRPPESRRRKGGILPQSLLRACTPAVTLILAQRNRFQTSALQNCDSVHFCCFKPPSSW